MNTSESSDSLHRLFLTLNLRRVHVFLTSNLRWILLLECIFNIMNWILLSHHASMHQWFHWWTKYNKLLCLQCCCCLFLILLWHCAWLIHFFNFCMHASSSILPVYLWRSSSSILPVYLCVCACLCNEIVRLSPDVASLWYLSAEWCHWVCFTILSMSFYAITLPMSASSMQLSFRVNIPMSAFSMQLSFRCPSCITYVRVHACAPVWTTMHKAHGLVCGYNVILYVRCASHAVGLSVCPCTEMCLVWKYTEMCLVWKYMEMCLVWKYVEMCLVS